MKIKELAARGHVDAYSLEQWLKSSDVYKAWVKNGLMGMSVDDSADMEGIIYDFQKAQAEEAAAQVRAKEEEAAAQARAEAAARKRQQDLANMLISSGFSFDGYTITKYSGYISGDDAVQIPRTGYFGNSNTNAQLTDALVRIRRQAIAELKEAAYDLGCNAIVGVDFDYITMEPQTATLDGGTKYEPYVICVTANGNAVVIEKNS